MTASATTAPPPPPPPPAASLGAQLAAALGAEHVVAHAAPPGADARTWRVTPGSPAEVAEVVRLAAAARAAIHPVGGGERALRGVTDGDRPRILLSTARLDQVLEVDEASLLVHAQAGLTGLALEAILAPRGLSLGDYPPAVLASTIGGMLAVRTPGKSSARHGFFEEAVAGVSAVLADGRSVHTRIAPRRSTGPDLARALCGSEGTLGVLTSAVLRIHRRPEARLVGAWTLPSVAAAVNATYLALREEAAPAGVRIYDIAEARLHFGLDLERARAGALLVAATAGPTDLASCDRDLIGSAVIAEGGRDGDHALAEKWWRRIHAGEATPGAAPTLHVMATPSKLGQVHAAAAAAMAAHGGAARAHISRFDADGAIVFVTLEPASPEALAAVERAVVAAGGYLGARAAKLEVYFRALRTALDPDGILNPGVLTS